MVGWIRGCGICGYGGLTVYIIHSVQLQFIPGMQGWSNMRKSTNIIHQLSRLKKKNHLIISVDAEKLFDRIQHHIIIKILKKVGIERNHPNTIKTIYEKSF